MFNTMMALGLAACVVLWAICYLQRGKKNKFAEALLGVAMVLTFFLLLMAIIDITAESKASGWSWAIIVLVLICWFYWCFFAAPRKAEKSFHDIFYEDHHNIVFRKHNDYMHHYLGDDISEFIEQYKMPTGRFVADIVEPAMRKAMDEYTNTHRA